MRRTRRSRPKLTSRQKRRNPPPIGKWFHARMDPRWQPMWMLRGEPTVAVRFASPDTVEVILVEGETVYGAIAPLSEVKMVLTAERDAKGGVKFLSPSEVEIVEAAASGPFVAPPPPVLTEPPPAVRAGKKGRKQRTQEQIQAAHGHGFEDAGRFKTFVSSYHIRKASAYSSSGIHGHSPDGIYTGTCDRCGTAIMNVYVFTDGLGFMHVGIDCASLMGVPPEELKAAKKSHYDLIREQRTTVSRAEARARARTRAEEEARKAREARESYPDLFNRIEALQSNPRASKYAKEFAARYAKSIEWSLETALDDEWLNELLRHELEVKLVESSQHVGKIGGPLTLNLFAFRDGYVGLSGGGYMQRPFFINFLSDGENVFVWKTGSWNLGAGDRISATFTVKSHTVRDGVKQTELTRPRKTEVNNPALKGGALSLI